MLYIRNLTAVAIFLGLVSACPDHVQHRRSLRQHPRDLKTRQVPVEPDFEYEYPQGWAELEPADELCYSGSMQSPLELGKDFGYSQVHTPSFDYPAEITGMLGYSGWSLLFTYDVPDNVTDLPSITFHEDEYEEETVYNIGWHLHTPSEHVIDGRRTHSEIHFVHTLADGTTPRSVVAFQIEPSDNPTTEFISQLPTPFSRDEEGKEVTIKLGNLELGEFWTYKGSLSTPPCSQGVRWFVSSEVMLVSDEDLENILTVSRFNSRPTQLLWRHQVNV